MSQSCDPFARLHKGVESAEPSANLEDMLAVLKQQAAQLQKSGHFKSDAAPSSIALLERECQQLRSNPLAQDPTSPTSSSSPCETASRSPKVGLQELVERELKAAAEQATSVEPSLNRSRRSSAGSAARSNASNASSIAEVAKRSTGSAATQPFFRDTMAATLPLFRAQSVYATADADAAQSLATPRQPSVYASAFEPGYPRLTAGCLGLPLPMQGSPNAIGPQSSGKVVPVEQSARTALRRSQSIRVDAAHRAVQKQLGRSAQLQGKGNESPRVVQIKELYKDLDKVNAELQESCRMNRRLSDEKDACVNSHARDVASLEHMLDSVMAENKALQVALAAARKSKKSYKARCKMTDAERNMVSGLVQSGISNIPSTPSMRSTTGSGSESTETPPTTMTPPLEPGSEEMELSRTSRSSISATSAKI